jgi:hypothetical protein
MAELPGMVTSSPNVLDHVLSLELDLYGFQAGISGER